MKTLEYALVLSANSPEEMQLKINAKAKQSYYLVGQVTPYAVGLIATMVRGFPK